MKNLWNLGTEKKENNPSKDDPFHQNLKQQNISYSAISSVWKLWVILSFIAKVVNSKNSMWIPEQFRFRVILPFYSERKKRETKLQEGRTILTCLTGDPNQVRYGIFINDLSTQVTELKERYIITTADFIGSVGGSLGFFWDFRSLLRPLMP